MSAEEARQRLRRAHAWLCALASGAAPRVPAVKLCGLTRAADVDAALTAGADMLGFVTDVPGSRRSVSAEQLAELCARTHAAGAGPSVAGTGASPSATGPWCVGVFVDEPPERLAELLACAGPAGPDLVQLHGHEDAAYVAELRRLLACESVEVGVIQAFRIRTASDVARANASSADMVLLDAGAGCGETFDWRLARLCTRPFFLAGGLAPENLREAAAQVRPWGVDMSSGIETGGAKDPRKMTAAVRAVRGEEGAETHA